MRDFVMFAGMAGWILLGAGTVWAEDTAATAPAPGAATVAPAAPVPAASAAPVVEAPPAPLVVVPAAPEVAAPPAPVLAPPAVPEAAPVVPPAPDAGASQPGGKSTMGNGAAFSMPSGDDPSGMAGRRDEAFLKCNGCVEVAPALMKKAAAVLKTLQDTGSLPASLVRLGNAEIEALLRGKSWTSAVIAGPFGKEYQRLLAFDQDGRGRWLNFHGGPRGYSTLCQYEVAEDLLCFSCAPTPAQCSAVYRDGDLVMAHDQEAGQLEVFDWIMDSRWEDNRFLAPH